jgi:D-glycero-alpha-D-manno-heptose-7-phosphate kinase
MIVEARTPTRIDLSGGTLDLYPLYLFLDRGVTNNAAIDIYSNVWLETRHDSEVHLKSLDTGKELHAPSADKLPLDQDLAFVARVVRFYAPKTGVNVTTHNSTPYGSGLGGSSSLLIALSGALDRLNRAQMDPKLFVDIGANLEAQSIGIPTGKQDYLAALYGGVNCFHFNVDGWEQEQLISEEEPLAELESRIILSFTGHSHFSGANNWSMLKRFMDNAENSRESMQVILRIAQQMREALLQLDFDRFVELLDDEWQHRKQLADGVTTPAIDALVEAAKGAGAWASKICGAGGGGCMITASPKEKRKAVEAALTKAGATVMPFRIARQGLTIREI